MTLIATILALYIERFLGMRQELRRFGWFMSFAQQVREKLPVSTLWQRELGIILTFTPILVSVAILMNILDGVSTILSLLAGVLILLFSLGPRNLQEQLKGYLAAEESKDTATMRWYAQEILEQQPPSDPQAMSQTLSDWVLIKANHRMFGVIFWFVILGPVGALFYRLACELLRHCQQQAQGELTPYELTVERLFLIINWLPTRLTAFSYAITGNFVAAYEEWRHQMRVNDPNPNTALLRKVAQGAMKNNDEENWGRATLGLIRRSVILWVTVLALLTLIGWSS